MKYQTKVSITTTREMQFEDNGDKTIPEVLARLASDAVEDMRSPEPVTVACQLHGHKFTVTVQVEPLEMTEQERAAARERESFIEEEAFPTKRK